MCSVPSVGMQVLQKVSSKCEPDAFPHQRGPLRWPDFNDVKRNIAISDSLCCAFPTSENAAPRPAKPSLAITCKYVFFCKLRELESLKTANFLKSVGFYRHRTIACAVRFAASQNAAPRLTRHVSNLPMGIALLRENVCLEAA